MESRFCNSEEPTQGRTSNSNFIKRNQFFGFTYVYEKATKTLQMNQALNMHVHSIASHSFHALYAILL